MAERKPDELSREELLKEVESLRKQRDDAETRWHAAEAELDQRNVIWARYARVYDGAPVAMLVLDEKGVIQMLNRAAAELLRSDQATIVGKPFIAKARLLDPPAFWRHLERCFDEETPVTTTLGQVLGPGDIRHFEMVSVVLPEAATGRHVVASTLVDIEHRLGSELEAKHAHAEERRIRARLEAQVRAGAAISEAHAEMHTHGAEPVLQAIAEQARHLVDAEVSALGIGGSPEEPFERWVESGVRPEYRAAIPRLPRRVGTLERVASGTIVRSADIKQHSSFRGLPEGHLPLASFLGVPVKHRDRPVGNLYVANKRTAPEFDEDDERSLILLAEYAAFVIEAALATEAEIRERARLRAIIDQLPECVIVKDAFTRLIPNSRALQFSTDSRGRVDPFGNPIQWDMRLPDGSPVAWEDLPLTRAFRQRVTSSDVEMELVTRDGREVPILVNATPIVDENGQSLGAVVVWREIEQLKRLERLRQEWAAVVAHDLRQPLGVIKILDNALMQGNLPRDEARDRYAFTAIDKAVARMNEMLEELVDSSLLEAHRLVLRKAPLHLGEVVREALGVRLGDGGRLRLQVEPELPVVEADRPRIERVLENLVSNALKYGTPDTEIVVSVSRRDEGIETAVTNVGAPLDPADIEKLFSRFYRAPKTRHEHGLGLGLYISRGLVEAHGGRLSFECSDGRTTFRFTLPWRAAERKHVTETESQV